VRRDHRHSPIEGLRNAENIGHASPSGCHDDAMSGGQNGVRLTVATLTAAGLIVLGGCGNSQDGAVENAVGQFYAALEADDGTTACQELAPRTRSEVAQAAEKPCAEAILEEDLPAPDQQREVATFGTAGQVRYGNVTTFLSRFQDGWHVVAAGCTPMPGGRYDCRWEAG